MSCDLYLYIHSFLSPTFFSHSLLSSHMHKALSYYRTIQGNLEQCGFTVQSLKGTREIKKDRNPDDNGETVSLV